MASSSGTSTGSLGSEEDHKLAINHKKQKRMLSNRESARRSRQRKQKQLDGLAAQIDQIRKENNQIVTNLNNTTHHYINVESENSVLRAQMGELSHRLESLNEIINYMDSLNPQNYIDSNSMNPWNPVHFNQPILASTDMFEY